MKYPIDEKEVEAGPEFHRDRVHDGEVLDGELAKHGNSLFCRGRFISGRAKRNEDYKFIV
jgi:hypothetical protein